jgi:hypothetical protein
MTLGDLIGRMDEPDVAERAIAAIRDLSLLGRVATAAGGAGMSAGEYAAIRVRSFANTAGDEAWVQLIGRCQAHSDPGLAALAYILEAGLPADTARC